MQRLTRLAASLAEDPLRTDGPQDRKAIEAARESIDKIIKIALIADSALADRLAELPAKGPREE